MLAVAWVHRSASRFSVGGGQVGGPQPDRHPTHLMGSRLVSRRSRRPLMRGAMPAVAWVHRSASRFSVGGGTGRRAATRPPPDPPHGLAPRVGTLPAPPDA